MAGSRLNEGGIIPEAMTRAERTRAAVAHGGSLRLLRFLGASAVVHGLLAVALLWDASPKAVPASRPSADEKTMVWFESPAAPPAAVAPRSEAAPVKRAPVAAPVAPRQAAPAREVKPSPAEPPAPAAAPEAAPEPAPPSQPASAQAEAVPTATAPQGSLSAAAPEGVSGPAAAGGSVGSHGAAAPGADGAAGSGGTAGLQAYARRLYQLVVLQRRYPASASRFGMEGTARVHLSVNRDGTLARAPRLERSSGHEVLDAEALRMVEAAAPFAPLPEGHARPSAEFVIPVDFSLGHAG
ncbi:MAG TPA: TonB family protein [Myxococcaceae bacterium]|nr:TonB family protein [Myxococcaceae bacterium]